MKPLARLMLRPTEMINTFFPTMEQDSLIEIKNGLIKGTSKEKDPNVKFYLCPNGHPYTLSNVSILMNKK